MKHKNLPPITPDSELPSYRLAKTIRLSMSREGRAHLTAVANEGSRRSEASGKAGALLAAHVEQPASAAEPRQRVEAAPSRPSTTREQHQDRNGDRRARGRFVRPLAYAALAAMGAGLLGAGVFSYEKHERAVAAAEQKAMGKVIDPFMVGQGRAIVAKGQNSIDVRPAGKGAPKGDVIVTDLTKTGQSAEYAVMGVEPDGTPNPKTTVYWEDVRYADGIVDAYVAESPQGQAWAAAHPKIAMSGPANSYYGLHREREYAAYSWNTTYEEATNESDNSWGDLTSAGYNNDAAGRAQQIFDADWPADGMPGL